MTRRLSAQIDIAFDALLPPSGTGF
jgi:hypothetical protein